MGWGSTLRTGGSNAPWRLTHATARGVFQHKNHSKFQNFFDKTCVEFRAPPTPRLWGGGVGPLDASCFNDYVVSGGGLGQRLNPAKSTRSKGVGGGLPMKSAIEQTRQFARSRVSWAILGSNPMPKRTPTKSFQRVGSVWWELVWARSSPPSQLPLLRQLGPC